jgi:hypothetical protein
MRPDGRQTVSRLQYGSGQTDPELLRAAYLQGRQWARLGVDWRAKYENHISKWRSIALTLACLEGALSAAQFGRKSNPRRDDRSSKRGGDRGDKRSDH